MKRIAFVAFVALPALAIPSPAAAHKKPDLVITKIAIDGLGNHPYAVLNSDGTVDDFDVTVTTTNDGPVSADPSKTGLTVDDGEVAAPKIAAVKRLKPHKSEDSTFHITGLKPTLGFTEVVAYADATHQVDESDDDNNELHAHHIPVEARFWTADQFKTEGTVKGVSRNTHAEPGSESTPNPGFQFEFDHFDNAAKQFVYDAVGPVKDVAGAYASCTSTDTKTVSHQPWANSFLKIDGNLKHYDATVTTSGEHYQATYFCNPGSFTTDVPFQDLDTFVGTQQVPQMAPEDTTLMDHGASQTGATFDWSFAAYLP